MDLKQRIIYPDFLRIISAITVVAIHITSKQWYSVPLGSSEWILSTFLQTLFRFAVPVFFMVSGMFMLAPSHKKSIMELYKKNVLRMVTAFIFWSTIYVVYHNLVEKMILKEPILIDYKSMVTQFIDGEYHLWFIYSLIGLYIVTPLLRKIVENKRILEYFLLIWFLFSVAGKFFCFLPVIGDKLNDVIESLKLSVAIQNSGYYCLGYYLSTYSIKKRTRIIIYISSIISAIVFTFLTTYISIKNGRTVNTFFSILSFTGGMSVFLFVKNFFEKRTINKKTEKIIASLAKYSFGVYLVHLLVISLLVNAGIKNINLPTFVWIVLFTLITAVISLAISVVLNHIPLLKKYIV